MPRLSHVPYVQHHPCVEKQVREEQLSARHTSRGLGNFLCIRQIFCSTNCKCVCTAALHVSMYACSPLIYLHDTVRTRRDLRQAYLLPCYDASDASLTSWLEHLLASSQKPTLHIIISKDLHYVWLHYFNKSTLCLIAWFQKIYTMSDCIISKIYYTMLMMLRKEDTGGGGGRGGGRGGGGVGGRRGGGGWREEKRVSKVFSEEMKEVLTH